MNFVKKIELEKKNNVLLKIRQKYISLNFKFKFQDFKFTCWV